LSSSSRILLIEDNRDLSNIISVLLTDAGYAVETAFEGEAGMQRALERKTKQQEDL
jgi:DNA-binding response OmpR family regulator